jgi:hypothetical protein
MAQGEFTKEEATASLDGLSEMFKAIPKNKQGNFFGHLNDIALFLEAAKRAAPAEKQKGPCTENRVLTAP